MGDNLDKVFVQAGHKSYYGEPVLNWALNHFDKETTKIILFPHHDDFNADLFSRTCRSIYVPRCAAKKFEVEILIPYDLRSYRSTIMELITKHGMKKFVTLSWSRFLSDTARIFNEATNCSCRVWFVDDNDGKLISTRFFNSEGVVLEIEKENEELKKMLKEELSLRKEDISRRENVEKELLSLIEQRKINEQEIDRLRQEIDQQKQEIDQQKQEASRREEEIIQREKIEKELLSMPDYLKLRHEHALRSNFTVEEIKQATRNFSDLLILGKGAYGTVYKGYLGGTNVAIKILNPECTQGVLGFKQEVAILTTCRHPNLVTLMGVCYESSALIYELLPNGSLEDHLSGENNTTPLTWQVRTRIMCEICIALNFLHSNKPNMIIHGDLKPDNILLDANFTSKLGDFGISRIIERSNTNTTLHYSTCNPVGTYLYIDPEFAYSGKLTEKSDVFSFGVIILRLLTGKSVQGIVSGVEEAMEDGKLDKMIDVSAGEWPFDQAQELAVLGLRCAQIRRIDRPNLFKEVWPILESLQRNI